jgi:O-antigen/teichoic acid export membrane protein
MKIFINKIFKIEHNLLLIFLGRFSVAVASIIAIKLTTIYLSPSQLGSISLLNSSINLITIMFIVPVTHYMTRGFLDWSNKGTLIYNIKFYIKYVIWVSLFCSFCLLILQKKYNLINGFDYLNIFLLLILMLLFTTVSTFSGTGLNILNQRRNFILFSNISAWTSLLASIVLINTFNTHISWAYGQIIGPLLASASIFILFNRIKDLNNNELKIDNDNLNTVPFNFTSIFTFSWPIVITAFLWWIQSQSYKFLLEKNFGLQNVGYFTIGFTLAAMPISMYETIIGQYLEPLFYKNLQNQNKLGQANAWNIYSSFYLPGLVIVTVFLFSSHKLLVQLLLDEKYWLLTDKIVPWALLIEFMRATGAMMYHLGIAKLDNKITILPVMTGAISAPFCIYFFTKIDSIYGTIIGLFISGFLSLTISVYISRKALPIKWPYTKMLKYLLFSMPIFIYFKIIYFVFNYTTFNILSLIAVILLPAIYSLFLFAKSINNEK